MYYGSYNTMISSRTARRLLELNQDKSEENLSPLGAGIDIVKAVKDMVTLNISIAELYHEDYLNHKGVKDLIKIVIEETRDLTLEEINQLIDALGSRAFLSVIERQVDQANAEAWDKGTGHAVEVRNKVQNLQNITEIIMDTPMKNLGGADD